MSRVCSERLALTPEPSSARLARQFVRGQLSTWGCEDLTDRAVLGVSELVTNAVLHTGTTAVLSLTWDAPCLRVELHDDSRGMAIGARTLASLGGGPPPDAGDAAASGRGLLVVAAIATTLGETVEEDGKTIWFELESGATDGGSAAIVQQTGSPDGNGRRPAPPSVRLAGINVALAVAGDDHLSDLARELCLAPASRAAKRLLGPLRAAAWSFPFDPETRERLRVARLYGSTHVDLELSVDADDLQWTVAVAEALEEVEADMHGGRLLTLAPPTAVREFRQWCVREIAAQLGGAAPSPVPPTLAEPVRTRTGASLSTLADLNDAARAIAGADSVDGLLKVVADAARSIIGARYADARRRTGPRTATTGRPERHANYLAAPLPGRDGREVGRVELSDKIGAGDFTVEDEAMLVQLARMASAAIEHVELAARMERVATENARLYELAQRELAERNRLLEDRAHVVETLQASLLPPELPVIPGMAVAARYRAGAAEVGGDFYDVFPLRGRHWGFIIGDVCGKGPAAAAKTALARHTIRTAAMLERRPADVLNVLNRALLEQEEPDSFCSVLFARLSRTVGGVTGELFIAGHPRPLVRRAAGSVECLAHGGALLGVSDGRDVVGRTAIQLGAGDLLVLYTDGITEARREGEFFGEEQLVEAVAKGPADPEALAEHLEREVLEFRDPDRADDLALLVVTPA